MLFFCPRAPSGRFDSSKGRLQKETQTVCGPEERPTAGQEPEPGMQDGGEGGRGCFEVGARAESWACETRWYRTGAEAPLGTVKEWSGRPVEGRARPQLLRVRVGHGVEVKTRGRR